MNKLDWKEQDTRAGFATMQVLKIDAARSGVQVRGKPDDEGPEWATWAIPGAMTVAKGDRVLTCQDDDGNRFVLGVIPSARPGGRCPCVGEPTMPDDLVVRAPDGSVLFEYDPRTRVSRIHVGEGGVEIVSKNGPVRLAGRSISLRGTEGIEISSDQAVRLQAGKDEVEGSLEIRPEKTDLRAGHLRVSGESAFVSMRSLLVNARTCLSRIGVVRCVAERVETTAKEIVEKATNVFRRAEGLTRHQTGRWHVVIKSSWFVKSRKTYLKSEKDIKLNGDKIHLG